MSSTPKIDPVWADRRPLSGETCVITHGYWSSTNSAGDVAELKRDALLFDRVYIKYLFGDPPEIPAQLTFGLSTVDGELASHDTSMANAAAQALPPNPTKEDYRLLGIDPDGPDPIRIDQMLGECYAKIGIMAEWTYVDRRAFLRRFSEGERTAYEAALNHIPLIDASETSWDQVLQFRSDDESVRKYRDLRLWLRSSLQAQSVAHATDIIGQRLDDYRWAIRKHGFQTSIGALKTLLDWHRAGLTVAASGVAAVVGGPLWSAIAGGLGTAIQIGTWIAERKLNQLDVARGANREVAILYDIQERFGLPNSET